ncbi:flagellar hook-associated protein [Sporolactobacillus sp. THM7-4]|nr:flagellar hook-associated protein [Sporolactobacillus sp. THM7-4]
MVTSTSGTDNGISINTINSMIGTSNDSRISGLASGIDVDSIVAQLMTAESQPLVQMQQNLQLMEWQRDDYRSMNTLLTTLQTSVQTMKLQGSYLAKTATSSNSSLVTATAGVTAGSATYTLSDIHMATSAYNNSASAITTQTDFDPSQSMWYLVHNGEFSHGITWNQNPVTNETHTVSSSGTTFSLNHAYIDINSFTSNSKITVQNADGSSTDYQVVQNQTASLGQVELDREKGTLTFNENQPLAAGAKIIVPDYNYDSIEFNITTTAADGKTQIPEDFKFDPSVSLNSILASISQSSVGVSAFYDPTNQMVSMTRTETGNLNANGPEMQFSGSFLTQTLQMTGSEKGGADATYIVNNLFQPSISHSNTFTLGGVTFTLQGNSATSTDSATIRVNEDTDTVYKSISDFVDKYNDTIKQINDKISETRNRDYPPLTDAQRSSMNDTDITAWTDKAKSGMLANDSILSGALNQMRLDLYSPVSGTSSSTMDQLAAIGITTSSLYSDHGKLIISDPDKLKEAISTNSQAVMELFTNTGKTTNPDGTTSTDYNARGIMQRLDDTISHTITQIEDKAGNTNWENKQYSMGNSIKDMNSRIDDFKQRLVDIENRYYSQFSAMETAIEQANSQAGYLQQFMGG